MATAIIKGLEKTDFEILVAGRDPEKTLSTNPSCPWQLELA